MVTIEELKLGNRTLETLKFLLSQITELETTISQINISEIKDANTLTKEQIATLQDVKNAVESINIELSSKKSDFDEKKQTFDTNMNAFRNDKADFDEKKADFDSKNSTALNNFAFISDNVEKINSVSALLTEAKNVLETIKPIEQRTQAALNTIANSQAKFDELEALKATLLKLKRSLERINTTGLISDNTISETTTYSSKKVEDLVSDTKITLAADIKSKTDSLTTIMNNQKQSIITLDNKINSTQSNLNNLTSSVSGALEQKADKTTFNTFVAKTTNDLNLKANKNDVPSVTSLEATFLKKTDKIDAYTKKESDEKFAPKNSLPELATEAKAGIAKLKNIINAKQTDAAVTEKAVSDLVEANKGLGVDQTWQDMKSQRQNGVIYTNTTGRAIMILVSEQQSSSSQTCELEINGTKVLKNVSYGAFDGCIISALIPAGATYKVIYKNYPPLEWQELR